MLKTVLLAFGVSLVLINLSIIPLVLGHMHVAHLILVAIGIVFWALSLLLD